MRTAAPIRVMRIVASIGVMRDVTSIGVMRDVASIGVMRNVGMPVIQYRLRSRLAPGTRRGRAPNMLEAAAQRSAEHLSRGSVAAACHTRSGLEAPRPDGIARVRRCLL